MKKNEQFEEISKQYFKLQIKRSPITATYFGLHETDHLLDNMGIDTIEEEKRIENEYLKKFESFSDNELSFDQRIDKKLFNYNVGLNRFFRDELKQYESNVDAAQPLVASIFVLFSREFAPFSKRIDSIISRLDLFESRLEQFKTRIKNPVKLWVELAIRSVDNSISLIETIKSSSKELIRIKQHEKLCESADKAEKALLSYKNYLKELKENAKEEFYMTKKQYERLIQVRKIGLSFDEILNIGYKMVEKTKKELNEIANRIKPGATFEEVRTLISENRPKDFNEAMKLYKETIERCHNFVVNEKYAKDSGTKLEVVETPSYMKTMFPIAAYQGPGKFEKDPTGKYWVTPPEKPEFLSYTPMAHIMNVSIHEGYPGHHLQITSANKNDSYIRLFSHPIEFIEGWALYCEEQTYEQGFLVSDERLFRMKSDVYWRSWRVVIDLKLCTGEMSFDEAVQTFVKELGMPENIAINEIERYTHSPGYQFSYLIGKHLLLELKNELKEKKGDKFSNYDFHNVLLSEANLPIFLFKEIFETKNGELEKEI